MQPANISTRSRDGRWVEAAVLVVGPLVACGSTPEVTTDAASTTVSSTEPTTAASESTGEASGDSSDGETGNATSTYEIVVTGLTTSSDLIADLPHGVPTLTPSQSEHGGGGGDAFIARMVIADDTPLTFEVFTYFGGSGYDRGWGLAATDDGGIVVTGETDSSNLPTTTNAFAGAKAGLRDAFVARYTSDGQLSTATYLGGQANDFGASVRALDDGSVVVVGGTASTDFPTSATALQSSFSGPPDAVDWFRGDLFVTRLADAGNSVMWSTYVGGSDVDRVGRASIDRQGVVAVTGQSASVDYPVTQGVYQREFDGQLDVVVTSLATDGTAPTYSTYFGGPPPWWDSGEATAFDDQHRVAVCGTARAVGFPTSDAAAQTKLRGESDAFVALFSADGTSLLASTLLGGAGFEGCQAIAANADGFTVIGTTSSLNFPVTAQAFQPALSGQTDAFVAHLSPGLDQVTMATYVGGAGLDTAGGVARSPTGDIVFALQTGGEDLPATDGGLSPAGSTSAPLHGYVGVLDRDSGSLTHGTYVAGSGVETPQWLAVRGR